MSTPDATQPMSEAYFWDALEYRVSRELSSSHWPARLVRSSDGQDVRSYWCDGFIPDNFVRDSEGARITGVACMGGIPGQRATYQERWTFDLFLGEQIQSRDEIVWSDFLPAPDASDWLAIDVPAKALFISPLPASTAQAPSAV